MHIDDSRRLMRIFQTIVENEEFGSDQKMTDIIKNDIIDNLKEKGIEVDPGRIFVNQAQDDLKVVFRKDICDQMVQALDELGYSQDDPGIQNNGLCAIKFWKTDIW